MSNILNSFLFDVNFAMGSEGVFTTIDKEQGSPLPPEEGYFLLLDGTNFLTLSGEDVTLL